jgi:TRAP-type mannitol/chloroaromatic compound transport system permease large subunit
VLVSDLQAAYVPGPAAEARTIREAERQRRLPRCSLVAVRSARHRQFARRGRQKPPTDELIVVHDGRHRRRLGARRAQPLLTKDRPALAHGRAVTFVLIPPLALIFLVLGTIFLGIATPTEGGAMGAHRVRCSWPFARRRA